MLRITPQSRKHSIARLLVGTLLIAVPAWADAATVSQTNLVTDNQAFLTSLGYAPAATVDPHLINPWGVSHSGSSPFWVSNQGDRTSTLYNGAGQRFPVANPLVVAIPNDPVGPAGPTGQVFNSTTGFTLPGGAPSTFIFANLDGGISGWNGAQGTTAVKKVDVPGAVYTGLALGSAGGNNFLYAANNSLGRVDVFDSNFNLVTLAGGFVDSGNPGGLNPFNVHNVNGSIFVSYASPGPAADEQPLGSGFVSEFDANGNFIRRFATGGMLLSPWGMEIAPSSFQDFAGALLVGNFSDDADLGLINAFNLTTGEYLGALTDNEGDTIGIPYMWELIRGNGGNGGRADALYLAAGIGDERHGLFASLSAVPEPQTWAMLLSGFGVIGAALRGRRRIISAV